METVTKKSEFEAEIVTVEPEVVIPEKVITRTVTLADLRQELSMANEDLRKWTDYKAGVLKELNTVSGQVALYTEKVNKVNALIAEVEAKGVTDVITPVEVMKKIIEEAKTPVEETPVEEVTPLPEEKSPV